MNTIATEQNQSTATGQPLSVFVPAAYEDPHVYRQVEELLDQVCEVVSPVWPLKDWIAVNPYAGLSERSFHESRDYLRVFSKCELLPSMDHFAAHYQSGSFADSHIEAAMLELSPGKDVSQKKSDVLNALQSRLHTSSAATQTTPAPSSLPRIATIAARLSAHGEVDWTEIVRDEIGKHCSAHYDEGQSTWANPWKNLPLYQAWRNTSKIDRGIEILGLAGFRSFVDELPHTVEATIVHLLQRLNIPRALWETFLLAHAFSLPGWSGWTKYQGLQTDPTGTGQLQFDDFRGLLAMSLAYDVAISETFLFEVNWSSVLDHQSLSLMDSDNDCKSDRKILLRAMEIAYRDDMLAKLPLTKPAADNSVDADCHGQISYDCTTDTPTKPAVQMAFCIDVRSERFRRHLEQVDASVDTLGVAGFFGLPFEYVPLGQSSGDTHAPVLLSPKFALREKSSPCVGDRSPSQNDTAEKQTTIKTGKKLWKRLQTSAVGCFSFVETMGWFSGFDLAARLMGTKLRNNSRIKSPSSAHGIGAIPLDLDHLVEQGIDLEQQTDLVEGLLSSMGLTDNFAPLVVLCGHGSQTDNNALAAGLDCGACGGHSGAPNARLAAILLNDRRIQKQLLDRGIEIPAETHFIAAWHNTTTDQIEWLDLEAIPGSHRARVTDLQNVADTASHLTREERLPLLNESSGESLISRASDWSQTRPEWGLAGNASMLIGPREMTRGRSLDGRAFLHSYNQATDPKGAVLESILTAPMVVAHWINMQYYASTVDPNHFGSGCKTIHNVVGQFGVLSGNGGDLQAGLPNQSLGCGLKMQHVPLRLQTVVVASRESIDRVIAKHANIRNLLQNGWVHMVAIDSGQKYRYHSDGSWVQLRTENTSRAESEWQVVGGTC
ncbi:YbcC family protein [Rhodopirellula europaea]|uniref:YbcC family protein n=1 Tax=Rhodopirellula europaea TaxID=1263866 RepID=UPI003D27C223